MAELNTDLKVGILGAGFSGMCAAIKLQQELNIYNYTIIDENHDVGGTWLTHTYPGCACDVVSHVYSYSFELNPDWSTSYARQPEILAYLQRVAKKHNLYPKIKFNHEAKKVVWDEKINKWRVIIHDKIEDNTMELLFDVVISGVGGFRTPNIPEQIDSFEGPVIHSSRWDSSVELENKIVAVIGSGCSAVQLVPELATKAKKLLSFQRQPAWVLPQEVKKISKWVMQVFSVIPLLLWFYRIFIFFNYEINFSAFKAKSLRRIAAKWQGEYNLRKQIPENPELQKKLTPKYEFGCKRVAPSNTFYKALALPQCDVITSKIKTFSKGTILTEEGNEYDIDVIILATGYKVQEFFGIDIIGCNSENILQTWKANSVSHFLGIMTHSAPNFFILLGPNTAYGHNSVLFAIECQVSWTIQVLREKIKRKSKVVSVKKSVEKDYMTDIQTRMKSMIWGNAKCGSWYENHLGINTTQYPGSLISYWKQTRKPVFENLVFD